MLAINEKGSNVLGFFYYYLGIEFLLYRITQQTWKCHWSSVLISTWCVISTTIPLLPLLQLTMMAAFRLKTLPFLRFCFIQFLTSLIWVHLLFVFFLFFYCCSTFWCLVVLVSFSLWSLSLLLFCMWLLCSHLCGWF